MLIPMAALAALALASSQQTDTTVRVRSGARLDVNNFGGEITVTTWGQSAVRVQATHSSRSRIEVSGSEMLVTVRAESRHGPPQQIDYQITVPPWMALNLTGVYTDITVDGAQGGVWAETVQGEVKVRGGGGYIALKSVNGPLTLEKARGRVELNTVNEDITATDVAGEISAETVNGGVTLERIESSSVDASTVNGDVTYDGTIKDGGRYSFTTHGGDLTIAMAENANASVSVSTFSGDFESDFPIKLTESRRRRFTFTIGSGSARVELESFSGDIRLRRPGAARHRED